MSGYSQKQISLKRAEISDLEEVLKIEKGASNLKTYSAMTNSKEVRDAILHEVVYLIKFNSTTIGTISYKMQGRNWAYISGFVVKPNYQGRGLAYQAIKLVLEELKNVNMIRLVVHPQNNQALKIYFSVGFYIISWKENYYGDGEPRLILEKRQH